MRVIVSPAAYPHLGGLCQVRGRYAIYSVGPQSYHLPTVGLTITAYQTREAADLCGVSTAVIRRAVKTDSLACLRLDTGRILIPDTALIGLKHDGRPRWTLPAVADRLGVTRARVHQMLDEGKLEGVKIGGTWRVYLP